MNKKLLSAMLILLLHAFFISAETVLIAPIIIYDKDSNVIPLDRNPSEEIYGKVSDYWFEGMLDIRLLSSRKYGEIYTTLDASRCCVAEEAEYILFGYIQKNEGSWSGSMKLYSANAKKTLMEFFSSDDINHYERLLDNLSDKILTGLEEITGLNRSEVLNSKIRPFELRMPASVFYWTPVDTGWNSTMTGIAGCDVGLELFPRQPKVTLGQILVDFSLRPELSYSYGMGKDGVYPLHYNGISFVLPVLARFHFNMRNSLYIGTGAYYEIELMSIIPKYEKQQFHYQNIFGLESFVGYELNVNEALDVFTEARFDFHFSKDSFLAVKAVLGLSLSLYKGEL